MIARAVNSLFDLIGLGLGFFIAYLCCSLLVGDSDRVHSCYLLYGVLNVTGTGLASHPANSIGAGLPQGCSRVRSYGLHGGGSFGVEISPVVGQSQ